VAPNPQRFTQCYVTLPSFRRDLAQLGIVVAAPIFRNTQLSARAGESFWYTFYSGFSFLQLPTRSPSPEGWTDRSLPLRWHLTTQVRQQIRPITDELPIQRMLEGVDHGALLAGWERQARLVSISEGQATAFLLQWLLVRRLHGALATVIGDVVDLAAPLRWEYASSRDPFFSQLVDLAERGFGQELEQFVERDATGFFRTASLADDLALMGVVENGVLSARGQLAWKWLQSRLATPRPSEGTLDHAVRAWLGPGAEVLAGHRHPDVGVLAEALLRSAAPFVRAQVPLDLTVVPLGGVNAEEARDWLQRFEEDATPPAGFRHVCRLVPQLHFLVRSRWTQPLRWVLLPIAHEQDAGAYRRHALTGRTHSALILMLEDSPHSAPYAPVGTRASTDTVLRRLARALPVLLLSTSIEEHHVRDELMLIREWWHAEATQAAEVTHLIRTIQEECEEDSFLPRFLDLLAAHYQVPPPPQDLAHFSRPHVAVDLGEAVRRATNVFEHFYRKRRQCRVRLEVTTDPCQIQVRPLEASYDADRSAPGRASAAIARVVLDMLMQRVSRETEIRLVVARGRDESFTRRMTAEDEVVIAVYLALPFKESDCGCSPPDSLERWRWGRGLHSLFSLARALDATGCEVANSVDNRGVIRMAFRRTEVS
jgi:hypothetical protein